MPHVERAAAENSKTLSPLWLLSISTGAREDSGGCLRDHGQWHELRDPQFRRQHRVGDWYRAVLVFHSRLFRLEDGRPAGDQILAARPEQDLVTLSHEALL